MRATFFNLEESRRQRLLDLCATEFAAKGFERASTNVIVREAGISKGLFFKYFGSKESVFLYLAKTVLADLAELQTISAGFDSPDILERSVELFARHMRYAREHPVRYRFILRAMLENDSPVHDQVEAIRIAESERTSGGLYEGVDWTIYRGPKEEVVEFLRCFDLGLRHAAMQALGNESDIDEFESYISTRLSTARAILTGGIYRTMTREESDESND